MSEDSFSNIEKSLSMIKEASNKGANLVCLPELFSTRYFPRERRSRENAVSIPGPETMLLAEASRKNRVCLVGGSLYEKAGSSYYNTSVVFDENGRMLGRYRKIHVPQDPGFYEQDYFSRGEHYKVFNTKFGKFGVLICFDQWYPEAARIEKLMGAEIIFYPTAIGTIRNVEQAEGDWERAWQSVQVGHAISNSVIVATVNRVGNEGDLDFWGHSFVSDQFGKVLVKGDKNEGVLIASCNLELGEEIERGWRFLKNRQETTYKPIARARK